MLTKNEQALKHIIEEVMKKSKDLTFYTDVETAMIGLDNISPLHINDVFVEPSLKTGECVMLSIIGNTNGKFSIFIERLVDYNRKESSVLTHQNDFGYISIENKEFDFVDTLIQEGIHIYDKFIVVG